MINQQLVDYIKQQSQQGISPENIKNNLLSNGWTETDINQAYSGLSTSPPVSKFNKKFIWVSAILLLFVAGGVFAFISYTSKPLETILPEINTPAPETNINTNQNTTPPITPQTIIDETADWNIYKSEKYGVEFKYPKEVYIGDTSIETTNILSLDFNDKISMMDFSVSSNPTIKNIADVSKDFELKNSQNAAFCTSQPGKAKDYIKAKIIKKETIYSIDGTEGLLFTGENNICSILIYINKGNRFMFSIDKGNPTGIAEEKGILTTLKFTK